MRVQHASRCGSWRLGSKVEGKRDEAAALWTCSGRREEEDKRLVGGVRRGDVRQRLEKD